MVTENMLERTAEEVTIRCTVATGCLAGTTVYTLVSLLASEVRPARARALGSSSPASSEAVYSAGRAPAVKGHTPDTRVAARRDGLRRDRCCGVHTLLESARIACLCDA